MRAIGTVAKETEEISEQSLYLSENAQEAKGYADDMSAIDEKISATVHHLIEVQNSGIMPMSNETFIGIVKSAIASHEKWLDTLEDMVNKGELRPIQVNGNKCAFGHFYRSLKIEAKEIKKDWDEIDDVHMRLHAKAYVVEEALEKGDLVVARNELAKAKDLSRNIMAHLDKILSKVKEMDKQGIKVFPTPELGE